MNGQNQQMEALCFVHRYKDKKYLKFFCKVLESFSLIYESEISKGGDTDVS